MKKYILTSVMSLFLIAGTSILLTATETERKEKTSTCCSSEKTAEVTKTAEAASCCSSISTKASAESSDVQMIQTSTSSAAASGCTGTSTTAVSSCSGSSATTIQASGPQPGECTKVPSGIRSQQANSDK
ncbi:MAG: hypothetical protein K0B37_18070 [Bacteroidales bacterium]|nr:hypothetical protein [Bacteroidales bacterium]